MLESYGCDHNGEAIISERTMSPTGFLLLLITKLTELRIHVPAPSLVISNLFTSYGHFCISKMAVSRHLGFYRTANSAIRSTDPENPSL